jgi:hypothetical protein
MPAHAHRGIQREAAVLPGEHLAHVVRLDQPAAGKPPQHPDAYLLGNDGEGLGCQVGGGEKAHGLRDITGLLGSQRQNCNRQPRIHQVGQARVQGAVSTGNDDASKLLGPSLAQYFGKALRWLWSVTDELDTASTQLGQHLRPRLARRAAVGIEQ